MEEIFVLKKGIFFSKNQLKNNNKRVLNEFQTIFNLGCDVTGM